MKFRNMNWAPYLLLLPSFIYLLLFFGWPMVQALGLAFRRDSQILPLRAEPAVEEAAITGELERGTTGEVLDVEVFETLRAGGLLSDRVFWLEVSGTSPDGETVSGWALRGQVFVADASRSTEGTVRANALTVRAEPRPDAEAVGELRQGTDVSILKWGKTESRIAAGGLLQKPQNWLLISGETEDGETIEGWVERAPIFVEDATISATGRVQSGEGSKEWTLDYVKRMVRDAKFVESLRTTLLLIVLILPVQFVLAIIMALVLQSQIKFSSLFLYIYAIPLGISDLAAGLVWYTIFTQRGYLNSFLQWLGLIDKPFIFISSNNKEWIILAIVLAEIWRATSIVMVIVVSGLQAIPRDYLEAGELFGASLWQRLRHIILPLLKPSLQVALILRTILAFQVFAVVVAISGGDVVTVLANEAYRWYDIGAYNNKNVAAAYSGFIMLLSLGIAVFYLRAVRTQEEREAAG